MRALTSQETQLKWLMQVWTGLFFIGGLVFLLAGNWVIATGNAFGSEILHWNFPPMPPATHGFWLTLTTSMMLTISVICYWIQKDIPNNIRMTFFILVSKLTSTVVFLLLFFLDTPYFNYLLGSLFSDGPIYIITLILYKRALSSTQT